jgi:hypothetical protein
MLAWPCPGPFTNCCAARLLSQSPRCILEGRHPQLRGGRRLIRLQVFHDIGMGIVGTRCVQCSVSVVRSHVSCTYTNAKLVRLELCLAMHMLMYVRACRVTLSETHSHCVNAGLEKCWLPGQHMPASTNTKSVIIVQASSCCGTAAGSPCGTKSSSLSFPGVMPHTLTTV